MDRREFLAASAVAAVSPLPKLDSLDKLAQAGPRQYIELRRYHLLPGAKQRDRLAMSFPSRVILILTPAFLVTDKGYAALVIVAVVGGRRGR